MTRLPFGPLARAAGQVWSLNPRWGKSNEWVECGGLGAVAARVGVDSRTCARWQRDGLSINRAEELAWALGLHPVDVWHNWVDVMLASDPEPEPEPGNRFGGRPSEYAAIGHERYYGLHGDLT